MSAAVLGADIASKSSLLTGLQAYYKLREASGTRFDSTINHFDLISHGVGQGTGVNGTTDECATFVAASSQYLSVPSVGNLLTFTSAFTIAGWYKANGTTQRGGLVGNLNGQTNFDFEQRGVSNPDNINATLDNFTSFGTLTALSPSVWAHWGLVFDSTQVGNVNRLKLYKNGALQTLTFTGTVGSVLIAGVLDTWLGQDSTGFLDGSMQGWGMWSTALSAAQINNLYNGGTVVDYPFTGVP